MEQLRVILSHPPFHSQGAHEIEAIFLLLSYLAILHNCPGIEVKESLLPGDTNSYLTLTTLRSVLFPFPGHSAGTVWVRQFSARVPRGYILGAQGHGWHFVFKGGLIWA